MSFLIDPVTAASVIPLPAYTATPTTLTGTVNGPLPPQDGISLALNDTLLVISETQAGQANCGGYTLTQVGSLTAPASPWILSRMPGSNTAASLQVAGYLVKKGRSLASRLYFVDTPAITLGTTPVSFIPVGFPVFSSSFVGKGTSADPVDLAGSVTKGVVLNLPGATIDFTTSGGVATGNTDLSGQITLISGTRSITIQGLTAQGVAQATLALPSNAAGTVRYQASCTNNLLTIRAINTYGQLNPTDISTLNYWIINL